MYPRISGNKARRWRREVAQHAEHKPNLVRTLKFPLDTRGLDAIDFKSIGDTYNCTQGIGKGSLVGLVCAVHLSGFRFFKSSSEAKLFLNRQTLPTEKFRKAWESYTGEGSRNFSPSTIIELLEKRPRNIDGKNPTYENRSIAAELYKLATGKQYDNGKEDKIFNILCDFEKQLVRAIPDRVSVSKQPKRALEIFDSVMQNNGCKNLPSLKKAYQSFKQLSPDNTTIVFDETLLTLTLDELNDTALHAVVAQKLHILAPDDQSSTSAIRKQLQEQITTETNNALSWLFGKGYEYWRNTCEQKIMCDYGIPDSRLDDIKALKSWFIAIPNDKVFESLHYSNFRSSVGGKLNSWIANYFSQLKNIESSVKTVVADFKLPKQLSDLEHEDDSSTGFTAEQLEKSIGKIIEQRGNVMTLLHRLLGKTDQLPTTPDVEAIESFGQRLAGVEGMWKELDNRIKQEKESTDNKRKKLASNIELKIPEWLESLPKINRISGGLPDFEKEIRDDEQRLGSLNEAFESHLERILSWARDNDKYAKPLAKLSEIEQRPIDKRGGTSTDISSAREQAIRKILHRLSRLAITGSDVLKSAVKCQLLPLFSNPKDLNRLLYNNKGAIYRSPYSNSRHTAYGLQEAELLELDITALLDRLIECVKKIPANKRELTHYRDIVRLKSLRASYLLSGLPDQVPTDEVLEPESLTKHVTVPMLKLPLLDLPETPRNTLIGYLNLYTSEINGVLARLSRKSFVLKTTFVRVNKHALFYVPKAKQWEVPAHYWDSAKDIGTALVQLGEGKRDALDAEACLPALMKSAAFNSTRGEHAFTAYLTQAPHDWYVDIEMPQVKSERQIEGLRVGKKGSASKLNKLTTPCRLVGVSSYKTEVDNWLLDEKLQLGEYNLMFLHHYRQSVQLDSEWRVSVQHEPVDVTAELALTFTDNRRPDQASNPITENLIGIDLGEAGLGYAVFAADAVSNIEKAKPIASGTIPIRSFRNLIKRVNYHRKHTQPKQKFQQRYNNALEQLRDNVVGDIAHVIDNLCWKYKGIPILESSVRNLASGSRQLNLVYDRVLNLYTFSMVDAHKAVRTHHWYGADVWEHPILFQEKREKQADGTWRATGKHEKLRSFPGSTVHPAGTSQTCSECGRNPIQIINDLPDKEYVIEDGGIVTLPDNKKLKLFDRKDSGKSEAARKREERSYRRQKLNAEYRYPRSASHIKWDELLKLVKLQLRQPQRSIRSKDTTQSRYVCVFESCRHDMHADENAAINIVRKWVRDKGIVVQDQATV